MNSLYQVEAATVEQDIRHIMNQNLRISMQEPLKICVLNDK